MNNNYAEKSRQYNKNEVNYSMLVKYLGENGCLIREHKNGGPEWAIYFYKESAVTITSELDKRRLKVTSNTKEKVLTLFGDLEKILLIKK